jgi:hypothetical protein
MVSKQIFEKQPLFVKVQTFAFIASDIIAAWRQIVLVMKRLFLFVVCFEVLELTESFRQLFNLCHFSITCTVPCSSFS